MPASVATCPGAPWHHWVRIGRTRPGLPSSDSPASGCQLARSPSITAVAVDVRTASRSSSAVRSGPSSCGRPARAATLPANPCAGLMYCATVP